MKIAFFDTRPFDRKYFNAGNADRHSISYIEARLTPITANLAVGHEAVCSFTNDQLNLASLTILKSVGVKLIALRSAGST